MKENRAGEEGGDRPRSFRCQVRGVVGKATPAVLRNSLRKQLSIRLSRLVVGRKEETNVHRRGMREVSVGIRQMLEMGRRPGWPLHP